jgi:dynein heavy chain
MLELNASKKEQSLKEILKIKIGHLASNFDRGLYKLIIEVQAWKKLIPFGVTILNTFDDFVTNNKENLRVLREYVMLVVRDYNAIIDFMD